MRRLAQEIITEPESEIELMQLWLRLPAISVGVGLDSTELEGAGRRYMEESTAPAHQRQRQLEGETMRFTWLVPNALILKIRKALITSLVAAAMVTAVGVAIGSATSRFDPGPLAAARRRRSPVP